MSLSPSVPAVCIKNVNKFAFILLITLILTVGCDQLTKEMARERLAPGETVVLMDGAIRLHYGENHGAFSTGAGLGEGPVRHFHRRGRRYPDSSVLLSADGAPLSAACCFPGLAGGGGLGNLVAA